MWSRISMLVRQLWSASPRSASRVILGSHRDVDGSPVILVDLAGASSSDARADAALTVVCPGLVLDVAGHLRRRRLAPAGWLVCGLEAAPYTVEECAEFVLALGARSGTAVIVDRASLPVESTRFAAHLRRSAGLSRRGGLSQPVTVLSSGRTDDLPDARKAG